MNKNRFAKPVAVAAGILFMLVTSGLVRADDSPQSALQTSKPASPMAQPMADSLPQDDFAGLDYTDKQRAEIDRIHRETESHKAVVANDPKLTADQKNAFLSGYTRMEYGLIFSVLSPVQQKQVRKRMLARKAAAQAGQKKQSPLN